MSTPDRNSQIEEFVDRFLDLQQGPTAVSWEAFAEQYPELAPELGERLKTAIAVHEVFEAEIAKLPPAIAGIERISCPHCGNAVHVVDDSIELLCRLCDSTFELKPGPTRVHSSAASTFGRFQLIEEVGSGAFGLVYRAYDPRLDREVAIKIPRTGQFSGPREEQRFLREARHAAGLQHANIVRVHEVGTHDGRSYIVSEFIEGLTLEDRISGGQIPFKEIAELIATATDAVHHAHQHKVTHRDIKPSNILLDENQRPFLTDFGLAKREGPSITMTREGEIIGTPAYMPPEQAAAEHDKVGPRSDVYSLGVVLYRMLSGELPFRGSKRMLLHQVMNEDPTPPRKLNDLVPRDLQTIALKAMEKNAALRYPSAAELAAELRRFIQGDPIRACPPSPPERILKWCRKYPQTALLVLSIVSFVTLGAIGSVGWVLHTTHLNDQIQSSLQSERQQLSVNLGGRARTDTDLLGPMPNLQFAVEALALQESLHDTNGVSTSRLWLGSCLARSPSLIRVLALEDRIDTLALGGSDESLLVASGTTITTLSTRSWEVVDSLNALYRVSQIVPDPNGKYLVAVPHPSGNEGVNAVTAPADQSRAWLWDITTKERVASLNHDWAITDICFSPNGRMIASTSINELKIWDSTGQPLRTFDLSIANSCKFGPGGDLFGCQTAVHGRQRLIVWRTSDWKRLFEINHGDLVTDYFITADEIWTAGRDGIVRKWNLPDGTPTEVALEHPNRVEWLEQVGPGTDLITVTEDGQITSWDTKSGRRNWGPTNSTSNPNLRLSVAPDRSFFTCLGRGDSVRAFWANSKPLGVGLSTAARPTAIAVLPDNRRVVTGDASGLMRVWDLAGITGQRLIMRTPVPSAEGRVVLKSHPSNGVGYIDPAGRLFQSASHLSAAFVELQGSPAVRDISFDKRGDSLAGVDVAGVLSVWRNGKSEKYPDVAGDLGEGHCVAFCTSRDGILASGHVGGVAAWSIREQVPLFTLPHPSPVRVLCFDSRGELLATGCENKTARVWSLADGKPLSVELPHSAKVSGSIEFSPDGTLLVTSTKSWITVWDWRKGAVRYRFRKPKRAHNASFLADGQHLLSADRNGDVCLRDLERPATYHPRFPSNPLNWVETNRKETLVLTSESTGSRLWDLQSMMLAVPPFAGLASTKATFISEEQTVLTASQDGLVVSWSLAPTDLPVDALRDLVALLTGRRYESGQLRPLEPIEAERIFEKLSRGHPQLVGVSTDQIHEWENQRALQTD